MSNLIEEESVEINFSPSLQIGSRANGEAIRNFIDDETKHILTLENIVFYKIVEFNFIHIWHKYDPTRVFMTNMDDLCCYVLRFIIDDFNM